MSQKPAHTAAQVAAANPGQSVWVSANAGTGKTHVLIERILRLLLAGTAPGKILCLTFTKAAAAEVANRLSARLGHWSAVDDKTLDEDLKALLGKPPSGEERALARRLFAATLEAPEGIRVRTIHSFAESLLGRFPVEAGLAPHFTVIDERRAAEIRAEARDRLFGGGKGQPAAVTAALANLAGLVNQDQFADIMKELDSKRGDLRRLLERSGGPEGLAAAARKELGLDPEDTRQTVLAGAAADGAFDKLGLMRAAKALDEGTQGDRDRAAAIRAWLSMRPARRADNLETGYLPLFLTREHTPRKTIITKGAKDADPKAEDILSAEQDRMQALTGNLRAVAMAEATESLLSVGEALLRAYDDMKRARALLDYDDLIEKAGDLLGAGGGVSWIHYKLDGGIDHILVDEAQDTSPAQWDIIAGLAGDFFAGLGAGDGDRGLERTIFAVGDEKQSIYSFQGADPARFGIMRNRFQDQVAALGGQLPEVELAVSYRSSAAVLKAVDAVFGRDAAADGLTWDGKPIHHHTNRTGQGGLVELWPTLTPDEAPEIQPWDAPLDQMAPESPAARLADRIAGKIDRMWRGKDILESAGRPIRPGDIMILVRTRGQFADEMVRALERRDIPVTGRDRLKLLDHLAVMDLVAAGRFALLHDDDLTTAVVLKGPFAELDEQALFDLAYGRQDTLWRTLERRKDEKPPFAHAHEKLSALLAAADMTPPYEFYAGLLGPGGGRRALLAHLGAEAGEPIDEFLGLALDFERDHQPSLEGFLHWLEVGEVEIKREMERGRNEVRVLTVHGAKGLEAEVVFLPDTCAMQGAQLDPRLHWRSDEHGPQAVLWRMSKSDEEEVSAAMHEEAREEAKREYRRLLYVAMTRARDRLYIGGWETKTGRPDGCWYDLVAPAIQETGGEETDEDGNTLWRIEEPQTADPDRPGGPAAAETVLQSPPPWTLAPPAPEPEPAKPLAPSRPSEDEPPVMSPLGEDDGRRFKRGTIIHRLLQSLPDLPESEREAAARAFLGRPGLDLTSAERKDLLDETLSVLAHPDLSALFGPGSLAEVPVTGTIGSEGSLRTLSGQVDRLVVTEDAVTVIDYKTNRPPPEAEKDVPALYLRQMAAYREVLREIYPDHHVRAVLLWTVGPRMMALGDEILDAHAP